MKKLLSLSLFMLILSPVSAQEINPEAFRLIEVWLDAQKDYEKLPGISAIAVHDQEVIWKGAAGEANLENNVPMSSTTIGSICSISKLFTSVAIMKLYEEGQLRLDDRVEDLLPWYDLSQQYADSGPITVRSLLTHSSGLPREANYPYWTAPDFPFPTREEIQIALSEQETLYPASTYFQYSNLGLTLLGEIVQEVSGMPYDTYVQEQVLTPLGLTNTRTELPEALYGQELAIGYSAMHRDGSRQKVNFFQANGIKPAAGYSSTVEDLGKFASWNLRLIDTTTAEILKPATLRNMHNVHWTDPDFDTYWGLGFSVYQGPDGSKWVGHGGSCPGYRSALMISPEDERAYAVIINAGGTNPSKYARGIHAILNKFKTEDENKDTEANLSDYTGLYSSQPWGSEGYIGILNGKLYAVSLPSDNPAENMTLYEHVEADTFRRIRDNGEPGETLVFERDENGRVVRAISHNNYRQRIMDR